MVHDLEHVAQAARVMAKQYGNEVGPWVPFLPVLTDHPVPGPDEVAGILGRPLDLPKGPAPASSPRFAHEVNVMRRIVAVGLALALACVQPAGGAEHLVSPAQVTERLIDAGQRRAADLESVDAALALPQVGRVAAAVGLDVESMRKAVPRLDDAELHELAVRAEQLRTDPVAGSPIVPVFPTWMIVAFLAVVIAVLAGIVWAIVAIAS